MHLSRTTALAAVLVATIVTVLACADTRARESAREPTVDVLGRALVPQAGGAAVAKLDDKCFHYAQTVELRGTLRREIHPGRPNFESIAGGDEKETGYYLHLPARICTRASAPNVPDEMSTDSVRRVQLVLDSAGYAHFKPRLNAEVSVRGQLFSAHTMHHHAPLLLMMIGAKQ